MDSFPCPASPIVGLNNYLYTVITLLTSPSALPDQSQAFISVAAAILFAQFINDPQTQYKNNPEILLKRKINLIEILVGVSLTCIIFYSSD